MNTNTVRLNISLPKDLVQVIDQMTGARKRSMFIAEAIELKLKQTHKSALEKQLAEGYRACRHEGLETTAEFENIDLEGWDDY